MKKTIAAIIAISFFACSVNLQAAEIDNRKGVPNIISSIKRDDIRKDVPDIISSIKRDDIHSVSKEQMKDIKGEVAPIIWWIGAIGLTLILVSIPKCAR